MLVIFFKSVLIGLSIAMPIGPIATLLIKNSLSRGWRIGFATGLGASLAEAFYGFVASGGFAFISKFLTDYLVGIKIFCGSILILLALFEIKNSEKTATETVKMKSYGFAKTTFFVTMLTLANPMTIILFVGIFASMGGDSLDASGVAMTVFGMFFGSIMWSTILSGTVARIRHKISKKWMVRIKVISGLMIGSFGAHGIISIF